MGETLTIHEIGSARSTSEPPSKKEEEAPSETSPYPFRFDANRVPPHLVPLEGETLASRFTGNGQGFPSMSVIPG